MNEWMKQEKLRSDLSAVFNSDFKDVQFANSYHMELVLQYGKFGFSIDKSLDAAKVHLKLVLESPVLIDDYSIFKVIQSQ